MLNKHLNNSFTEKLQANKKVRKTIVEQIPMAAPVVDENQSEVAKQKEAEERIAKNLQKSTLKRGTNNTTQHKESKVAKNAPPISKTENIKTDSSVIDEKRPLKTVNKDLKNTDTVFESQQKPAKRYELKSVKVRKVTLSDEPEVIEETSRDEEMQQNEPVEMAGKGRKGKKSQQKIVKVSEEPVHECETQ